MTQTLRIDLPILLPAVFDARDACVQRLMALAATVPGVERAHVDDGTEDAGMGGAERVVVAGDAGREGTLRLCIHYDPARVTMAQVETQVRAAGAGITERYGHALLHFSTVDSEDAGLRIEDGLRKEPGVLAASVNMAGQVARIEFDKRLTSEDRVALALRRLLGIGRAAPAAAAPTPRPNWYSRNTELAWSLAAGVLLMAAWVLERWAGLPHIAAVGLYLVSYGFGAFDLVSHTLKKLRRGRFTFDIDLLMLLAAVGAAAIGAWAEGAFLLFLFSLAHAMEHYGLGRARDAIKALADLAPPMARVLRNGTEHEVPVGEVAIGEIVIVRPGDRIAVDGNVRAGRSAVDQAPITGESVPVDKEPGAEVFAGTVNGEGALEVETTRAAGDRTLDRVVRLVTEAQTLKAPTQLFTERFERIFVPITLAASALLIIVPPLLGVWTWSLSFYRAMTLLVAASPCAVAIGTPAAVLAGIAQAARRGVLIKGGAHLENLGTINAIAFDKTGTLTIGKPEVTDLRPADGISAEELIRVSAAVERRSQHPLAAAIVRRAQSSGIVLPEAGELQSVTAKGVRSEVEGKVVEIGSLRLWEGDGVIPSPINTAVDSLQKAGRSIVVVRHGERWLGVIGVADQPRAGARAVLDQLRGLGIQRIVMLTGDNRGVGEAVGREVGVDEVKAGLLPEDKVAAIREMVQTYGSVAMVGDGVNDAPALANATVGIAMGGAGTAVALETADAALMGDDLSRLPFAFALSRRVRAIILQNLFIALGVIAVLVTASVGGWSGIGPTVIVHEGSTLVVLANALRLLVFRGPASNR
ncbi:MAG: cadmium-translocating P-type ATPase [Phycisphaerales bacterium]|nr:cadmium-translocating P-type ATPase [Phycisphaerales bacterium]